MHGFHLDLGLCCAWNGNILHYITYDRQTLLTTLRTPLQLPSSALRVQLDPDKGQLSASIAKGEAEKHGFHERSAGEPPEYKSPEEAGVALNLS